VTALTINSAESRGKFQTRKFLLSGSDVLKRALAALQNVPLDPDKPLELVVREEQKQRGLDANGLYWMRLGEIAEQAVVLGKKYSKEVWHEYARQNLMPEVITTKEGELRSKWIESPSGQPVTISTTFLERRCFSEYIQAVEAYGAGIGVRFSANPKNLQEFA